MGVAVPAILRILPGERSPGTGRRHRIAQKPRGVTAVGTRHKHDVRALVAIEIAGEQIPVLKTAAYPRREDGRRQITAVSHSARYRQFIRRIPVHHITEPITIHIAIDLLADLGQGARLIPVQTGTRAAITTHPRERRGAIEAADVKAVASEVDAVRQRQALRGSESRSIGECEIEMVISTPED